MSDSITAIRALPAEETKDLGFGSRATQKSQVRFLNRDGTFNISRLGISPMRSTNIYHALLTISWPKFFMLIVGGYFFITTFFALAYFLCGPRGLNGLTSVTGLDRWFDTYFFSVQTFSTIGYGGLSPRGLATNSLVTLQSLSGLLFFTLASGLIFARFSRPKARILFSDKAVIAPYRGITAFEFRIINAMQNQLVNLEARVMLSRKTTRDGRPARVFEELALERDTVTFFPMHWTVVHPIDEHSPLHGWTARELEEVDAEFIILLTGFDETFSQAVHTRSSYKYFETIIGAKYADMFRDTVDGSIGVDFAKLNKIEAVESVRV